MSATDHRAATPRARPNDGLGSPNRTKGAPHSPVPHNLRCAPNGASGPVPSGAGPAQPFVVLRSLTSPGGVADELRSAVPSTERRAVASGATPSGATFNINQFNPKARFASPRPVSAPVTPNCVLRCRHHSKPSPGRYVDSPKPIGRSDEGCSQASNSFPGLCRGLATLRSSSRTSR